MMILIMIVIYEIALVFALCCYLTNFISTSLKSISIGNTAQDIYYQYMRNLRICNDPGK